MKLAKWVSRGSSRNCARTPRQLLSDGSRRAVRAAGAVRAAALSTSAPLASAAAGRDSDPATNRRRDNPALIDSTPPPGAAARRQFSRSARLIVSGWRKTWSKLAVRASKP
jgi:hypothetical protein